jgi:Flp pilus assembly protein TadG
MVEFALIFPIALTVLFGAIAGSYLFFQSEAVTNGARGGVRWATINSSSLYTITTVGGPFCEAISTHTIVDEVHTAANILALNTGRLCTPALVVGYSTTQLRQPIDNNKAYIVVDAAPSLASPDCITVTVVYAAPTLGKPFPPSITLAGHSGAPVGANASTTCPAGFTPP